MKYWEQDRKFERKTNMAAVVEEMCDRNLLSRAFSLRGKTHAGQTQRKKTLKQPQFTLVLALKGCDGFEEG